MHQLNGKSGSYLIHIDDCIKNQDSIEWDILCDVNLNQIEILKSSFTIKTIKFDDDNFYKRLREKLFWGQDMRNKNINN